MLLKFGKITEVDEAKGLARVTFEENDLVSDWLPMGMPKTLKDKYSIPYDVNEHVYCIMDENCEDGVIAGAVYDDANTPAGAAPGKTKVNFNGNMTVEYDRQTSTLTIEGGDFVKVKMGTTELVVNDGFLIKKGSETLKQIFDDVITQIKAIVVPTNVGPSGIPINGAAFDAIQARADNLLK